MRVVLARRVPEHPAPRTHSPWCWQDAYQSIQHRVRTLRGSQCTSGHPCTALCASRRALLAWVTRLDVVRRSKPQYDIGNS